jgi:PhoPQ-activated pathogenicity-related protein
MNGFMKMFRFESVSYLALIFIIISIQFLVSSCSKDDPIPERNVSAESALQNYIDNDDNAYRWEFKNTYNIAGTNAYDIELTSQRWREYTWTHQLTILVPQTIDHDGVMLWITGGSNNGGLPKWTDQNDPEAFLMSLIANSNNAVVAILRQVPNQPLYQNLYEDALISYTLNAFRDDGDYTWPLLFPMVKSASRAMDAVTEFLEDEFAFTVSGFTVSGASKRGWTTWLTGAMDRRVEAIAPAVIDILNMPVNVNYQQEVWGDYSIQIQDYVDLGIAQDIHSVTGADLVKMIDPFSYREKLTMPKMIFIGTNDPYWPVDAIKHYFSEIPGENFIHYVANAGHDLGNGQTAMLALNAFWTNTLTKNPYPICTWHVVKTEDQIKIEVGASDSYLTNAYLWSADSDDRDFRDANWSSTALNVEGSSLIEVSQVYPESGFRAFYVDLEYIDSRNTAYTKSTRMFVCDQDELFIN